MTHSPQPSLFVPHGAPTFALRPGAAGAALSSFAHRLAAPRAIVIISPHWDTTTPVIGHAPRPETIHDFMGFPEALYALRYPATGCPEVARLVHAALIATGLPVSDDAARGLDHGAWVPLRLMFPDAEIPVIPLSIQSHLGARHHYQLGLALAPLAAQGILVIGSGNVTHNLRDYQTAAMNGGKTPAYVNDFAEWLHRHLITKDIASLLDYRRLAPEAARAHPTDEHLLPLFVALGAAGEAACAERFHAGIDDYVISMDAYSFSPGGQR